MCPLQTDLNISPYYDDFDETKDFYKILFRPGVAVQVRELNQLQTLLQKQVERFGDFVLQRGTIVSGCGMTFHTSVPYVKLKDTTVDGRALDIDAYVDLQVKSTSTGLFAQIIDNAAGYETQDPDLNTLYIDYKNAGASGEAYEFTAGETVTIYNKDLRLYNVQVGAGSTGFSNNDGVIIMSAVECQNTEGGTLFSNSTASDLTTPFNIDEVVTQVTTGAQAVVVAQNTTANDTALVVQLKPVSNQQAIGNTVSWAFGSGYEIVGETSNAYANVMGFVGSGATGELTTAGAGRISQVQIIDGGEYYYVPPYVTAYVPAGGGATAGEIDDLSLTARNYLANVEVSELPGSTGESYGITVDDGIIYQKGFFSRVENQYCVVEKYSNTPHEVVVGFITSEAIVNSAADSTLLDNATGQLNYNAPGANRLELTPILVSRDKFEAQDDPEFLPLVEFAEGKPWKKNTEAQLNLLGEELARRTYDESGNYVLDEFLLTTKDHPDFSFTDEQFAIVIDPGKAYINGYRVQTETNYVEYVDKGTEVVSVSNASIDIVYGNYVKINEMAGTFIFNEGATVSLRDVAGDTISGGTYDSIGTPPGAEIGTAKIRSLTLESGEPGTAGAVYRLYLFDIRMNAGRSFTKTRSVWYDGTGTFDAIADIVLEVDPTTQTSGAVIKNPQNNALIFGDDKIFATKTSNSLSYQYRTLVTAQANTEGKIVLTANTGDSWPYTGVLTSTEERDLIVIPSNNDIVAASGITGTVTISGSTLSGAGGAQFLTDLAVGDFIEVNGTFYQILAITSDTTATLSQTGTVAAGNTAYIAFPGNVPIPLHSRDSRTATVSGTTLTIDLGVTISATSDVRVVHNARTDVATPVAKTVNRKAYVKLNMATHPDGVAGPWCLGLPDIFRLRAVYDGANTSSAVITQHFYIDHNQTTNYYDLGYLYKKPTSSYTIGGSDVLLVEFDVFSHNLEGVKTIDSMQINDNLTIGDLDTDGTVINTVEIPEVNGADGLYYDLRDAYDFRPRFANTVAIQTVEGSAPENPAEANTAAPFHPGGKRFPVPESDLYLNYQFYAGRVDSIIVTEEGDFQILKNEVRPNDKKDEIVLYTMDVPPYPTIPQNPSDDMLNLIETLCGNERYDNMRAKRYQIKVDSVSPQPRGYTMEDIGKIENRIESLEYYAQLSDTENSVKTKVIPSSVDGTTDRFKFGFFVDNYTTEQFSAINSPEYNASIYEYRLMPARKDLDLQMRYTNANAEAITGLIAQLPYTPQTLISQANVTDGPVIPPTPVVVPSTSTQAQTVVTVAQTAPVESAEPNFSSKWVFKKYWNTKYKASPASNTDIVVEDQILTLTSNTQANGTAINIYFNVLSGNDRIEVYQSTSYNGTYVPVANSQSAVNPTTAQKILIRNKKFYSKFNYGSAALKTASRPFNAQYWVKNSGYMTIPYDISKGRYVLIRVVKGSPAHYYAVNYPVDDLGTPSASGYLKTPPKIQSKGIIKPVSSGSSKPQMGLWQRLKSKVMAPVKTPSPPPAPKPKVKWLWGRRLKGDAQPVSYTSSRNYIDEGKN